MPQMMPMIWFIMMIFFIFCLMMTISFLYFFNTPQLLLISSNSQLKLNNWNWMW